MNAVPRMQLGPGAPAASERRAKVLLLCGYPKGSVPGQRFRYEQYLDKLNARGVDFDIESFLDESVMRILYTRGNYGLKAFHVLKGFFRRVVMLPRARKYDFVFIYREASPVGPPIIEWCLFAMGCKVIYDFDDAIFVAQKSKANPFMPYIRCAWKISYIARKAHIVSVCNPYLLEWARERNSHVALIPTTIDENYHKPATSGGESRGRPVIGWTGAHSTARYLDLVRPALTELQQRYDFEFRVICDHDPGFPEIKNYRFVKWRLETEVEDLSAFDIGLMPVPDGDWERGKVGFKAIQYSGLGMASVVSETGSGREVVVDGETGYAVANDTASWTVALERLLADPHRRREMGRNARTYILKKYSVGANVQNYLRLFGVDR